VKNESSSLKSSLQGFPKAQSRICPGWLLAAKHRWKLLENRAAQMAVLALQFLWCPVLLMQSQHFGPVHRQKPALVTLDELNPGELQLSGGEAAQMPAEGILETNARCRGYEH
jgi:hypothetical protein